MAFRATTGSTSNSKYQKFRDTLNMNCQVLGQQRAQSFSLFFFPNLFCLIFKMSKHIKLNLQINGTQVQRTSLIFKFPFLLHILDNHKQRSFTPKTDNRTKQNQKLPTMINENVHTDHFPDELELVLGLLD